MASPKNLPPKWFLVIMTNMHTISNRLGPHLQFVFAIVLDRPTAHTNSAQPAAPISAEVFEKVSTVPGFPYLEMDCFNLESLPPNSITYFFHWSLALDMIVYQIFVCFSSITEIDISARPNHQVMCILACNVGLFLVKWIYQNCHHKFENQLSKTSMNICSVVINTK